MPIFDHAARVALAASLTSVLACSPSQPTGANQALARAEAQQRAAADDDGTVLCARAEAALTRGCSVEQASTPRGLVLTLRNPDGGFHRLLATRDGRGLVAADGAVPARVAVVGADLIEVAVGDDRYRLPATVRR